MLKLCWCAKNWGDEKLGLTFSPATDLGIYRLIFSQKLWFSCMRYKTTSPWAIVRHCFCNPSLAILVKHQFVTDGRTDRTVTYTALAKRRVGKNSRWRPPPCWTSPKASDALELYDTIHFSCAQKLTKWPD